MPSRLLSLSYGANLVWGPEIVDRAMLGCERTVDPITGVVSFSKDGKSVWETHPIEKKRLIFQIGSASPELAAQAALMVQDDVAAVDLNCGCPKRKCLPRPFAIVFFGSSSTAAFSTSGAMGAMLLTVRHVMFSV